MVKHFCFLVLFLFFQSWLKPYTASAQTITPDQIPSIVLWLRADSLVTRPGNNVTEWKNCVNPGMVFSPTLGPAPTWVDNVLNGKPVVRFNGVNNSLSGGNILNLGTNSRTAFIVAKQAALGENALWSKGSALATDDIYSFYYYGPTGEVYYDIRANATAYFTAGLSSSTDYNIITTATNRNPPRNSIYFNSNQIATAAIGLDPLYSFNTPHDFLIGYFNNQNQFPLNGDIAEFIIYDSALADSNRLKVERYLCLKYGSKINLGADILQTPGSMCSISLTAPAGFTGYQWSTLETTATISVTQPGEYWVSATNSFGCETRDTIRVSFISIPDTVLCPGNTLSIGTGLSGSYTYAWSNITSSPEISVTAGGVYSVSVTDASPCSKSDTFNVAVNPFPTLIGLGSDDTLCVGNLIGLQSGAQYVSSYLWSEGGAATPTIQVDSTDNYSVTVTDATGCTASDVVFITIAGVAPDVDFEADTVCQGLPTNFTGSSSSSIASWSWDFGDTGISPSFVFSTPDTHNVTLTVISSAGCSNSVTKQVKVIERPTADFNPATDACLFNSFSFNNNSTAGAGDSISIYHWSFGDGGTSTLAAPSYTYTSTGNKTVILTVTTREGCVDSDTDVLSVVTSAPLSGIFSLSQPPNGYVGVSGAVNFAWFTSTNAASYTLQVSTDALFSNLIYDSAVAGLSCSLSLLPGNYYWQVFANNVCGIGTPSEARIMTVINPSSICALPLWLRADNLVDTISGTHEVIRWNNSAQNDTSFGQLNPDKRPRWVNNVWNGKPAIRFDGVDDFLSAGDNYDMGTSSRTVFMVSKADANDGMYGFYTKAGDNNDLTYNKRFALLYVGDPRGLSHFIQDNIGGFHRNFSGSKPTGVNIWGNLTDRSLGLEFYQNGVLKDSTISGFPNANHNINSNGRLVLGAYSENAADTSELPGAYLNGDIAEMIVYDCALPDNERIQVEQYLRFKYAPQVNLGPDIDVKYGACDTTLDIGPYFTDISWSTGETAENVGVNKGGTYWVTAKDMFGYTTSDTIVIDFPYGGMTGGNSIICLDDSTQLTQLISPSNAYNFVWVNTLTSDTLSANSNSIYVSAEGSYFSIISDTTGCILISDTVFVDVDSLKLHSLVSDTAVCSGNEIAVVPYQVPFISYLWTTPVTTYTTPAVTVDQGGVYTVVIRDTNQCTAADAMTVIKIGDAPNTDFTFSNACLGDSVNFNNLTIQNGLDNINMWSWAFGDGNFDSVRNPSHLYTSTGAFQVNLFLTTDSGCTGVKTKTVNVFSQPNAGYTYNPQVICAAIPISFADVTAVTLPDTLSWQWIFNSTDLFTDSSVVYTFQNSGDVPLLFIVTTSNGCADTVSAMVEVFPSLAADFSFSNVCFGDITEFIDVTPSFSILTWQWNFGDNSFVSNLQNPTHKYLTAKTYNVKLTVTNAIGCVSTVNDSVKIAAIPVAVFTDQNACEGYLYAPQDSSISLNDSIVRWDWNIADSLYPNTHSPQHLFPDAGNYPVTLLVTTQSGCKNSVTRVVTIDPNPTALFGFSPLYGEAPLDVTFNNLSTGAAAYLWNFGDNSSSVDANPTHTYSQNDTYNITLTAFSDLGCVSSYTQSFIVIPTMLDLSVDLIEAIQTPQINGYVSVSVKVRLSNQGTRLITSAKLYAILGSGSVITEDWTGSMPAGAVWEYTFTAAFIASAEDANSYVCVDAGNVNGGETESRTDNNRACTSLDGAIQLVGPLPNPVSDRAVLGIILPKAGKVNVAIINSLGQYVVNETELNLPAGRSDFEIPAHKMSAAEYFIRVIYNDDKFIRKFVVKR